jgi:hypothetical protein
MLMVRARCAAPPPPGVEENSEKRKYGQIRFNGYVPLISVVTTFQHAVTPVRIAETGEVWYHGYQVS